MAEATRWHVNSKGETAPCHAKKQCRLGANTLHGTTPEEARSLYEAAMIAQGQGILQGESKRTLRRSQRPKPVHRYKEREYEIAPDDITVPHDPNAHYAVLSDVDGTITKGSLVLDHAIYIHKKGLIDLGDLPEKWLADQKNEKLVVELAERYKDAVAGHKVSDLHVEEFLDDYEAIPGKFYKTLEQLEEFKRRRWEVQLISGSPNYLVSAFAERHGFFGAGSDYKVDEEGRLTGEIEGMFGHAAKEGYIQKLGLGRFKRVLAFGDTASDAPLFEHADHSTLVDPTEETLSKVHASLIVRE